VNKLCNTGQREVEMTMGIGFPLEMGISWDGTNIESIVGMGIGMGKDL